MKKIFLTVAAIAISIGAFAQADSSGTRINQNESRTRTGNEVRDEKSTLQDNSDRRANRHPYQDGYTMKRGKVMVSEGGRMTTMEKEVTFSDGSVLMSDGTILRKDGTKLVIQDGEYVDLTGKVIKSDRNKDMYLVPDSTKK